MDLKEYKIHFLGFLKRYYLLWSEENLKILFAIVLLLSFTDYRLTFLISLQMFEKLFFKR